MSLIDHTNTKVLLIGTSEFPEDATITPIPNVKANISRLQETLVNAAIIGIPKENIVVSFNEDRAQIERKLKDITDSTHHKKYTLLIYYTGHGILSSEDYNLYLTTNKSNKQYLEIESINIDRFKSYIKRSLAGRKIVIIDSCHSGAIIGSMNDISSSIQAGLKGFEGTYVMTSAAENEPSLFPVDNPEMPTYFTNKLIEVVNSGLEIDSEYCSLRDIFNRIKSDFAADNFPTPQQSNYNNADQLYFSMNPYFLNKRNNDEVAWEEAILKNKKWDYYDFIENFPQSHFAKQAKEKIYQIEELECWNDALLKNRISAFTNYLDQFSNGQHAGEAKLGLQRLREAELEKEKNVQQDNQRLETEEQERKKQLAEKEKREEEEQKLLQETVLKKKKAEAAKKRKEEQIRLQQEEEDRQPALALQEEKERKKQERLTQKKEQEEKAAALKPKETSIIAHIGILILLSGLSGLFFGWIGSWLIPKIFIWLKLDIAGSGLLAFINGNPFWIVFAVASIWTAISIRDEV